MKMKIPSYMKSRYPVLLVAGLAGLVTVVNLAPAQQWTATGAPFYAWNAVASSADGTKVAAVASFDESGLFGPIYTSIDCGATWMPTTAPADFWQSIASSADGTKLVAASGNNWGSGVWGGAVYISPDSGTTWMQTSAPTHDWVSVASSADGTKLAAASSIGPIYTSSDSGATWTWADPPAEPWQAIASSADGSGLLAVASEGPICTLQLPIPPLPPSPSPRLSVSRPGGSLGISWLVPSSSFVLQQNPDLRSTDWTDVPTPPALNFTNLHYEMTVSPSLVSRFYRLKQQ
jgi:hypothetical protein